MVDINRAENINTLNTCENTYDIARYTISIKTMGGYLSLCGTGVLELNKFYIPVEMYNNQMHIIFAKASQDLLTAKVTAQELASEKNVVCFKSNVQLKNGVVGIQKIQGFHYPALYSTKTCQIFKDHMFESIEYAEEAGRKISKDNGYQFCPGIYFSEIDGS